MAELSVSVCVCVCVCVHVQLPAHFQCLSALHHLNLVSPTRTIVCMRRLKHVFGERVLCAFELLMMSMARDRTFECQWSHVV